MMSAVGFDEAPLGPGNGVTLVEGSSFCVSDDAGWIASGSSHGVFYLDTRVVATWRISVDGEPVEPLAVFVRKPYHATFLGRARQRTEGHESALVVERERYVGVGMREDIVIRNSAAEPAGVTVEVAVDADFADLFAVKEGRTRAPGDREIRAGDGILEIDARWTRGSRGIRVRAPGALVVPGTLVFREIVPARGEWRTTVQVLPTIDGVEATAQFPTGEPLERAHPTIRLREWEEATSVVWVADDSLQKTLRRTAQDLGSLRIFDPDHPERAAVAAGAPWFMALFGRDSLLTAYMALTIEPQLSLGTLHTLARYQGRTEDPITEEQPGRILHEMRFGVEASLALGGGRAYYGTADATPLFVAVLGELWRWGMPDADLEELLPHADRALEWIRDYGDADGDGFVEYRRLTDRGLRNQGWKDSWDGINFAGGQIAEPPIALCEVQGYVYAAYVARADIARAAGQRETAELWAGRARDLKAAFNERFWLPDKGWFAVGLDRDKRPIDSLTSNIGHCLWTGIIDDDKAAHVAEHLLSPAMFTGWGIRTLASTMGAYNPISYHNGSVWPHDNAIIATGLMRYGYVHHARTVADGILAAAECFSGRLPELFTGLDRRQYPRPVDYPTSCSPQAWASATPVQLMRALLRLEPDVPENRIYAAPALPDTIRQLHINNAPIGDTRIDVRVDRDVLDVQGLPPGLELITEPKPVSP